MTAFDPKRTFKMARVSSGEKTKELCLNRRLALWRIAGLSAFAVSTDLQSQQPSKTWRIGFLGIGNAKSYAYRIDALRAGLRDVGYWEGKNVAIEYRWAEGMLDRLPSLAATLVQSNVDVIVTHTAGGVRAAQAATTTIPIVMTDVFDAIDTGLVQSLSHPGGNVTGSTLLGGELNSKRLEMLSQLIPKLTRVGLLLRINSPVLDTVRKHLQRVSQPHRMELREFGVTRSDELASALQSAKLGGVQAMLVIEDPLFTVNTSLIAALAMDRRLPIVGFTEFADAGGLFGYGVDFPPLYYRAAYFVDRILKGTKPGELPVEQATKFELIINTKTATTLGITIPQSMLVRADRIIE